MTNMWWLALIVGPLISGAAFVGMLASPKRIERALFLPAVIGLGVAGASLVAIATLYERFDALLYSLAFVVAAMAGGYALASISLGYLATRSPTFELSPREGSSDAHPFVVVSICAEPKVYSARATAEVLQHLTDEGLLETSVGVLPFIFLSQKSRYASVGGASPAMGQLQSIAEQLQTSLAPYDAVVHPATCRGASRIAGVVAQAVNAGHRRIVLVQLPVVSDANLNAAITEVAALRAETHGVDVHDAGVVGTSDRIIAMLAERIADAAAPDPARAGVALVCHGQPIERAHSNPAYDDGELLFVNRLRLVLTERGFAETNVRPAWAEWSDPDVTSTVRHLAATGCTRVIVCPAVYPLDSLATRIDLEAAVRQARTANGVTVLTLPAWKDDPAVVEALRALVADALDGE